MIKNEECKPLVKTSFSGTYKGAEVLEPKQGFYHNVVVVDATSLYPSVGINYNLLFDTINCKCCKNNPKAKLSATLDNQLLKDCKFVKKDSWLCKKEIGAFTRKLRLFRTERLKQKDLKQIKATYIKDSD
jgi:DNA polymerase, archaea type